MINSIVVGHIVVDADNNIVDADRTVVAVDYSIVVADHIAVEVGCTVAAASNSLLEQTVRLDNSRQHEDGYTCNAHTSRNKLAPWS